MSKLDQPLKVKHGLVAVVVALTLGIAATAIPMATAGGGGGDNLQYVKDSIRVRANSQAYERVRCPRGSHVLGGGAESSAGFSNARGMMLNSSNPVDLRADDNAAADDAWEGSVDVFENAGGETFRVYAICRG